MKLPDFVIDFLPPSHTVMHQKQGIEDCVHQEVQAWDHTRPVEVLLTSGYGHPLRWVLHEFKPVTAELLKQYQYRGWQEIRRAQKPESCGGLVKSGRRAELYEQRKTRLEHT